VSVAAIAELRKARPDLQVEFTQPALPYDEAFAALRKVGGFLMHRANQPNDPPVVMIDATNNPKFTDECVRYFASFPQLRTIGLNGSPLTDAGAPAFADVPELESLLIAGTKITNTGLLSLAECQKAEIARRDADARDGGRHRDLEKSSAAVGNHSRTGKTGGGWTDEPAERHTATTDRRPWARPPPAADAPPLERPTSKAAEWKWSEPKPADWAPTVRLDAKQAVVTFYSYTPLGEDHGEGKLGKERLIRHTETYRRGKYRPLISEQTIAEGPNVVAF